MARNKSAEDRAALLRSLNDSGHVKAAKNTSRAQKTNQVLDEEFNLSKSKLDIFKDQ